MTVYKRNTVISRASVLIGFPKEFSERRSRSMFLAGRTFESFFICIFKDKVRKKEG
jgi:hypothetical protein